MQLPSQAKTKKLVIYGDRLFAEVAYECFTRDSAYEVSGFAVERDYLTRTSLFGLPVVPVEDAHLHFPTESHEVYVAIVFNQLNRLRTRLMHKAHAQGYTLASYVSSHAFVWPNVTMGRHCFIFENNVLQPFVSLGENVILWSGNHVGHHTAIADNVFISSHVVISGSCQIGQNSFLGVNSTVADGLTIGRDAFLNIATAVTRSLDANAMYRGNPVTAYRADARAHFDVPE